MAAGMKQDTQLQHHGDNIADILRLLHDHPEALAGMIESGAILAAIERWADAGAAPCPPAAARQNQAVLDGIAAASDVVRTLDRDGMTVLSVLLCGGPPHIELAPSPQTRALHSIRVATSRGPHIEHWRYAHHPAHRGIELRWRTHATNTDEEAI